MARTIEGWSPSDSKNDRDVVGAIRFLQIPFIAWVANLALVPLQVFLFWGRWNPAFQFWFSVGAAAYATWVGVKGWIPWEMWTYRAFGNGDSAKWDQNPTAVAVATFLQSPHVRWTAAAITGLAALTPLLISGASRGAGGTPFDNTPLFRPDSTWSPVFGMAFFGFVDGLRSGTLATLWVIGELRKNWSDLHEGSGAVAEVSSRSHAEYDTGSLSEFLHRRGVSRAQAILWFLVGLMTLGIVAYLSGVARRHGF